MIDPEDFLPLAEETGLILQIDEYVQKQAFHDVAAWRNAGLGDILLSVNLTAMQIEEENFVERFTEALESSGLAAEYVKLEITENTLMQDMEKIIPKLKQVQGLGVRIAIDDFGTGYSSLAYLQQFPINTLKIDRSFVSDIRADDTGASIVDAIVSMARGLKLDLVAEGVENPTQLRYLKEQGCEEVQGYIFSPAVPASELAELLKDNGFEQMLAMAPVAVNA